MIQGRYEFILSTIKQAGKYLLDSKNQTLEISLKNDDIRNIVTNVDLEVNKFISEEIKKNFPREIIYSEEESNVDISLDSYWAIDPIDGTSNFSRNIPHFAVVITYVENGIPTMGGIYNPITNELFSFEKGKGAFLNEMPVKVSENTDFSQVHAFLRIGSKKELWDWGFKVYRFLLENANKTSSFGSSGLDLCFVGCGRLELCIYGTMTTRDIAGAIGFVREAGGIVVDQQGNSLEKLSSDRQIVIAVNNSQILQNMLTIVS